MHKWEHWDKRNSNDETSLNKLRHQGPTLTQTLLLKIDFCDL